MRTASLCCILLGTLGFGACATAPVAPPAARVVGPSYEQKLGWILRLEDQRVLRDPAPPPPPPAPAPPPGRNQRAPAAPPAPPPLRADLTMLVGDTDARIRRVAALAIGRVGLAEGGASLLPLIQDPDPDVRQMACFALGLLHARATVDSTAVLTLRATEALTAALRDPDLRVQGRAAEALGSLGDQRAAPAIGEMVARLATDPAVVALAADDLTATLPPAADAFRLGLYALVRLKGWEPLAAAVLDGSGAPRVRWWPVAYAVQRIEDPRAVPALLAIARGSGVDAVAFAARGLGVLKEARGVPVLLPLLEPSHDRRVVVSAVRALGQIGNAAAVTPLLRLLRDPKTDVGTLVETINALALLKAREAMDDLLDAIGSREVAVRGAAINAVAAIDQDAFIIALSGLDPDRAWQVRADLARALGQLPREQALPQLNTLVRDDDLRVVAAAARALGQIKAPTLAPLLRELLTNDDLVIRSTAAQLVGEARPTGGDEWLREAWRRGKTDAAYVARGAAVVAISRYGLQAARATLEDALDDADWAIRLRAAQLLTELDPRADVSRIRPAPVKRTPSEYESVTGPSYSTQAYIETKKGTVQIELSVLDAPLTVSNFVTLARKGFFNGVPIHRVVPNFVVQDGDPRGDGEGGPGYTIRDEINQRPYLRGTLGMALDWADTGGSQFFITHGPQPHLDGRYTVFGNVVSGMDVVDQLEQWDTIERISVWDGVQAPAR
jgi:cyclophilin family peptidyl-prolyl cis-trans isomerase/HEAT repeat protein